MSDHNGSGNGSGNGAPSILSPTSTALARPMSRERTEIATLLSHEEFHLDQEMMTQWIFDKSDPKQKRLQCESFLLVHDKKDGPDVVTTSPTVPKKGLGPEDRLEMIRVLVAEFADESETRTAVYPERQRFKVCGYLKEPAEDEDRAQDPICTRSFLVSPPESSTSSFHQTDADGNDGPDAIAVISQLQRLVEVSSKQLALNLQESQNRLLDWNQSVMKQNAENEERSYKRAMEMEKLLDDRARREAEATEKRMHVDAQWQVIQGALSYAKAFGDQYLQKKGMVQPGAEADAAQNQLAMLGETFEPVQLVQILTMLRPDQEKIFAPIAMGIVAKMPPEKQQMVGALLERHQQEKERRAAQEASTIKVKVQQPPAPAPPQAASAPSAPSAPQPAPVPAPVPAPSVSKKGAGK